MAIQPYQLQVKQAILDDLRARLGRARRSPDLGATGWKYGTDPEYLDGLIEYWRSGFDWRQQEAQLNALPQYTADLDGDELHFVHVKGRGPRPMPLLLLHGWPDSFCRYVKVIPVFSDPAHAGGNSEDAFDVVVPSLPGFPLTGPIAGLKGVPANRHTARLLWRLMTDTLGYATFAVAGGDGGSVIAQILAIEHPEAVIGVHLTDIGWHATNGNHPNLTKAESKFLDEGKKHFMADGAYAAVQMSKPRSLAVGLNDSPVGLASWILDRFHSWTDSGDDIEKSVSKDELLTNITLYWATQTIGSSMYSYFAEARQPSLTPKDYVQRPVALALFPKDGGAMPPRSFAERTLNVTRYTEMPRGGHFAALEEPALFAADVTDFFRTLRGSPIERQGSKHHADAAH
jgi:pimeloyl-ACP methyl ester carboxylesterase